MKIAFLAALVAAAGAASASVRISEIGLNPSGGDNGFEWLELSGPANSTGAGLWLIQIEGDGTSAGVVDIAIDLGTVTFGSNGLWLRRDAAAVIDNSDAPGIQGPSAGTSVTVADFNPDIENGTQTWAIVFGFSGSVGSDIDANNDGIVDNFLWTSVLDAVSWVEDDTSAGGFNDEFGYGANLGGFSFGPAVDTVEGFFTADALARGTDNAWYIFDNTALTGDGLGIADPEETVRSGSPQTNVILPAGANFLTPGAANVIPTPGALALAGIAGLVAARRRRA